MNEYLDKEFLLGEEEGHRQPEEEKQTIRDADYINDDSKSMEEEKFEDEEEEDYRDPLISWCEKLMCRFLSFNILNSPRMDAARDKLTSNFVSDETVFIKGVVLCEGPEVVRLFKFFFWTILMILMIHPLIRWVNWEHDTNYSLWDFVLYDLNHVTLDILSFFFIGRLYKKRGIDHVFPFLSIMFLGAIVPSWQTNWAFLRHSVSMYEIVCHWPWELFVYVVVVFTFMCVIIWMHVRYMALHKILLSRLFEIALIACLFLFPYASDANFHFHHWYFAWMVGMHFNLNIWWSQCVMAFLWGQYVNGIAVYGRDPILTCNYAYYISTDEACQFMNCNYEDDDSGGGGYVPFDPPNWRNCSGGIP